MSDEAPPALLRVLEGETLERPPVWLMRQAGRYLPEYRELRAKAPDFIAFCLDPEKAAEVTLQPMRRFPLDAAIVFADILLIPLALGQPVRFEAGEGPKLGPLPSNTDLHNAMDAVTGLLAPVGETLARVREALEPQRALIGFAGAPWTVATYMIEGGGSPDKARARTMAYEDPERLDGLLGCLVEATARYLKLQALSGAQTLQLFESWAEGLPEDLFERLVIRPQGAIVERLRAEGVDLPIIGFPRGAGSLVEGYAERTGVTAVGLDTQASAALGRRLQASGKPIQGALDPLLLQTGGAALERRIDQLLEQWSSGPWVFNLGHGISQHTPIAHVERLVARVKGT
ncbi:MAG TPA: uroporphyrinogen decarboxylase [Caulobacteraceae bacterium]|jgi:uroporphyrinogen decarboxylase